MRLLQLLEKYTADNTALLRYMKDKPLDTVRYWHEYASEWISSDDMIEDRIGQLAHTGEKVKYTDLPKDMRDSFDDYVMTTAVRSQLLYDPTEAPTWGFMDLSKQQLIKPDTWLVHFSNNARDICINGFTVGMDQMDGLGLTTHTANSSPDKSHGGYNFAFLATDKRAVSMGDKYGSDVVVFQNSGVEAYHNTDTETQIMFIGKDVDPRGIVWIAHNRDDGYDVMSHPLLGNPRALISHDFVNDAIEWVKTNLSQYRKVITGY